MISWLAMAATGAAALGFGFCLVRACLHDVWDGIVALALFIPLFMVAGGAATRAAEAAFVALGLVPDGPYRDAAFLGATTLAALALLLSACAPVVAARWISGRRQLRRPA